MDPPGNPVADRAAEVASTSSAAAVFVDDQLTDPLNLVPGAGAAKAGVAGVGFFARFRSFFSRHDVPGAGANSAADANLLNKRLASDQQMGEAGTTIAGAGSETAFRDAERVAAQHGGRPTDWAKRSSTSHTAPDGTTFETHWVENVVSGQRVEFKTKY